MSPRFVLGRENMPCVAEVVNRSLKADCTDFTYHFVSLLKGFNNSVAYSLHIKQVYYFVLKATSVYLKYRVKPCFDARILLVVDEIFVHEKCSDKICCPSRPVNRYLSGYLSDRSSVTTIS